jgi:hypothetical protein
MASPLLPMVANSRQMFINQKKITHRMITNEQNRENSQVFESESLPCSPAFHINWELSAPYFPG